LIHVAIEDVRFPRNRYFAPILVLTTGWMAC